MNTDLPPRNIPLVELIVEIRWEVNSTLGSSPIINDTSTDHDLWQNELARSLYEKGFNILERLIPHSAPTMAHQPIYRYRMPDKNFPVCQFGHGIFTINAGPPNYESWKSFEPIVLECLNSLLNTRPKVSTTPYNAISLRYIDSFNSDLRNNLPNYAFIRNELGISICIPSMLLDMAADQDQISPTIAFKMQLKDNENAALHFQIAEGRLGANPEKTTIMDMKYIFEGEIETSPKNIIDKLNEAHKVLHTWFSELTDKISDRLDLEN